MHVQELDRILRGLGSVMDSLASVSNIVTMHDCLNPIFNGQIDRNTLRTTLPHKRKRTSWSIEDTQRFVDQMNDMSNMQLGELFGRGLTEIVNKRRVEGRKSKRRLAVA
jgi:hypothetical protein